VSRKRLPVRVLAAVTLGFLAAVFFSCAADESTETTASVLPAVLTEFIESGRGRALNPGFIKFAYGNIAEGMYFRSLADPGLKKQFAPQIEKIVGHYLKIAPADTQGLRLPGDHGNYLSNLNLILGVYEHLTGRTDYEDLHRRINARLVEGSRSAPSAHFPSLAGIKSRWPADQAFVLYTVSLADKLHGTAEAPPLVRRWEEHLAASGTDEKTGLPFSELTGNSAQAKIPRGCALSYMILYTAALDGARARDWFEKYKRHFLKEYVFAAGFRETEDEKFKADADSGPILDGVGAAATAFGIGAAYELGDDALAARLAALIDLGRRFADRSDARVKAAADDIVAQAIAFNMDSRRFRRAARPE
jgi:hypothetical protein